MITLWETVNLEDHEEVVQIFRTEKGSTIRFFLIDSVIVLILFFFMTPLFRAGPWGVGFFLVILAMCGLTGWRAVFKWLGSVCITTTARLIVVQREGFWKKEVREVAYKEIVRSRYIRRGMVNSVSNVGSVECILKSATDPFLIEKIVRPKELMEVIGKHTTFSHDVSSYHTSPISPPTDPKVFSHFNI
ncbi:MAG: hypothetical protein Q8P11_01070 [bacterium]|nr:hypothetical protein [bacterium]